MRKNISNVEAIRTFFREGDSGREVMMKEFKDLTSTDREILGELCREALQES